MTNVPTATNDKAIRLCSFVDWNPDYVLLTACVNVISAYFNDTFADEDDIFLVDVWEEKYFQFPPGTETQFDKGIYYY